ncbi:glycosyltransferase family 2 protein [Xanthovirga aplysinae]|uniref:glycosyltransferase family 2 protein n=1 Tax=Xanthovirga aplysinae TaxID=2529853 RepID=UPI0012BBCB88|nr:glycosyltransferase family 2 protein [Xanthovirga aplysinae]MTI32484.1 glycosyltransferase family 2 protein [Xanthovirga aplysinae]
MTKHRNVSLVSIIMPTYNASQYISEAITSVLNQSYEHWELLIINDGSTDQTEKQVLKIKDSRIRYFKQENKGVSAARNVGLREMKGDYFCFLDADDTYPKDSLNARIKFFIKFPDAFFVDGRVDLYDHNMKGVIKSSIQSFNGPPLKALLRLDPSVFFGPSWMIRRVKGKNYAFIEQMTHSEDLCFYLSIANDGLYKTVDQCILNYRTGNASAMSNLKGLEGGYRQLVKYVKEEIPCNYYDRFYLLLKTRKIMFLSYLADRQFLNALKALF